MKFIRFQVNDTKPYAREACVQLEAQASSLGLVVKTEGPADAIISLGGDGTFLRTVHEYPDVPVLGLNLGGLGYLASVEARDFTAALEKLVAGRYQISERHLLEVNGRFAALNDIVVARERSGHSLRLDLEADGRLVTRYMADGLIFATPTGSTAYSLAAGGPVLMPDSGNLVVTPISPHALSVRPLVVRDAVCFVVTARSRTAGNEVKVGVYSDGENVMSLGEDTSITISKSEKAAKIIELEGYNPYEVLAHKLGWSGSNVS